MANHEHLAILKQGVEQWNAWRKQNPRIKPDLIRADLFGADLFGADLRDASFSNADLRGANLTRAALGMATLRDATLRDADLRGATLSDANLRGANLRDANLRDADLRDANLRGASLGDANLGDADLRDANLSAADLSGASLSGASLSGANLSGASLSGADLSGANLSVANLRATNLGGANLSDANLRVANLSVANLSDANLSRTSLQETVLANCNLTDTQALDTCKHQGPSTLDHRTLINSGELPAVFLQGCGWLDWQIEAAKLYNPSLNPSEIADVSNEIYQLRQGPLQLANLFISYSHQDAAFVNHLEKRFQDQGIRYWRDIHDATSGRLEKQINKAIQTMGTVLLILSEHSVQSDWVEHEVRTARKLEKDRGYDSLCPIALDDSWKRCKWPERIMEQVLEYNILDFSEWSKDPDKFSSQYGKLIKGLRLFYESGSPSV